MKDKEFFRRYGMKKLSVDLANTSDTVAGDLFKVAQMPTQENIEALVKSISLLSLYVDAIVSGLELNTNTIDEIKKDIIDKEHYSS